MEKMTSSVWSKTLLMLLLMQHVMIAARLRTLLKDWCLAMLRWCVPFTSLCKLYILTNTAQLKRMQDKGCTNIPSLWNELVDQENMRSREWFSMVGISSSIMLVL